MRVLMLILGLLTGFGPAAAFPTKQVLIVVPFAAGGSNDIFARILGERLQRAWGQNVLIENQTGAAGSIGVARVAKSEPDGHTLVVISITFTINAVLQAKQAFDPVTSFAAVALLGRSPMVIAVSKQLGVTTPQELVALAKSRHEPLTYGSAGVGSITHIGAELLAQATGIKLAHVPYRGTPLALNDMIGGHVDLIASSLPPMLEQIRGGKVVGIAVTSDKRMAVAPEIPTVSETIAPGFQSYQWWAILAPAGTPPDVVSKLNADINSELASEEMKSAMAREGADVMPGPPKVLGDLIASDMARWQKLVDAGVLAGEKK